MRRLSSLLLVVAFLTPLVCPNEIFAATAATTTSVYGPIRTFAPLLGTKTATSQFTATTAGAGELVIVNGSGADLSPKTCTGGLLAKLVCVATNVVNAALLLVERPSSVEIVLNGVVVVAPSAIPRTVNTLTVPVALKTANSLVLNIKGTILSSVSLQVKAQTSTLPVLTLASPQNGDIIQSSNVSISGSSDKALASVKAQVGNGVQSALVLSSNKLSFSGLAVANVNGVQDVKITAVDTLGNQVTLTRSIKIQNNVIPIAVIDPNGLMDTAPSNVRFNGLASYDTDGSVIAWHWLFSDGGESFEAMPTHAYASPGSYTVTLRVQDNLSAWSDAVSLTVTILANQAPIALINVYDNAIGRLTKTFDGSASYDGDGTVATYQWTRTDSGQVIGSTAQVSYTFPTLGTYSVSLLVRDNKGLASTVAVTTVTIKEPTAPVPRFTTSIVNSQTRTVALDASSSSNDGPITGYLWTFQDGSTASGSQVQHSFSNGGFATVKLTVTNSDGISRSVARSVSIQSLPVTQHEVLRCNAR